MNGALPDMSFPHIKFMPCFELITPCKFIEHRSIICRIVACDMSNLGYISVKSVEMGIMYLVDNVQLITDFVKSLSETGSVVSSVQLCESKQCLFLVPFTTRHLFDPVSRNRKVAIGV